MRGCIKDRFERTARKNQIQAEHDLATAQTRKARYEGRDDEDEHGADDVVKAAGAGR